MLANSVTRQLKKEKTSMVVIKFVLGNPCPAVQLKPRDGVATELHFLLNYFFY